MKRRKLLPHCWNALMHLICSLYLLSLVLPAQKIQTDAAIVPPPWSDPEKNPCASMPGGWQLLYWPPLKKCFKIFTIGYPCPETMELSPTATVRSGFGKKRTQNAPLAECRCPPGTALSAKTNRCHAIFERGPCVEGEYFAPIAEEKRRTSDDPPEERHRWGECRIPQICPERMIFWPKDGKCYTKYTKGPCAKGKLLVLNEDGLGECRCENVGALENYFFAAEETCHEHYTKGPCSTPGHLFLPGGRCDCHDGLPHFHHDFQMCFELNSAGPCPPGHIFVIPDNATALHAKCQCKEGYVPWPNGRCYRLYTRGPCAANEFLINATHCVTNFCGKSRLYFPDQKSCYRIGSQGPCDLYQVVIFDFTARPSIDGISYNGLCGCSGVIANLDQKCNPGEGMKKGMIVHGSGSVGANINKVNPTAMTQLSACEATPGMVELNGNCYKLYSRGPCGPGQWLQPLKTQTENAKNVAINVFYNGSKAKCVCRPGYTKAEEDSDSADDIEDDGDSDTSMKQRCNAPSVGLARYLTVHQRQRINSKFPAVTFNQTTPASTVYRFQFL